jgi:carboxylesterase type B
LNVWTPVRDEDNTSPDNGQKRLHPVLVRIHGGGFQSGSSELQVNDGQVLSAFTQVVLVSFNYRLGVYGFFYSGNEDAPGNVGLHDQVLALKWVQKNIKSFGGDPEQVTIFGESVGSISVGLHLLSPLTHGLFHRAIMESGSPLTKIKSGEDPEIIKGISEKIAEKAGCISEEKNENKNKTSRIDMDCLRELDEKTLTEIYIGEASKNRLLFPIHGDDFNPLLADQALIKSQLKKVDLLIGTAKYEFACFLYYLNPALNDRILPKDLTKEETIDQVNKLLDFWIKGLDSDLKKQIFSFYFDNVHESFYGSIRMAAVDLLGDVIITCPSVWFAQEVAKRDNKVYYYQWSHTSSPHNETWFGPTHFEEVQFIFGAPFMFPERYSDEERSLARRIMNMISDFAKNVLLNRKPTQIWPLFDAQHNKMINIETTIDEEISWFRITDCEFWKMILDEMKKKMNKREGEKSLKDEL